MKYLVKPIIGVISVDFDSVFISSLSMPANGSRSNGFVGRVT